MNETTTNANNTVALRSNFFNNKGNNTLFNKLKGIAQEMPNFDRFLSVVGYFRSSGYFKLRKELSNVKEIKILVGINVDKVFAKRSKQTLFSHNIDSNTDDIIEEYKRFIVEDIAKANYSKEIEDGIMQLIQDLADHKLQIKIHKDKNLHAKFYLCLPTNHTPNSDGWVIMGSSNISDSGLGIDNTQRYELNVAMKDYDNVAYCLNEFNTLWEQAINLSETDVQKSLQKTHLTPNPPTPYELYLKVLIETFGKQVEDDFQMDLPTGVKNLKYQQDAAIQGYQMLMQHNGIILADVVGLGKTMIAAMICKRFIAYNGRLTNILVIYPPALKENWVNTFELFKIRKYAQFVTNGSLNKVLEEKNQYKAKEEFDIIIVDEAHGFRSDNTNKYDQLQKICKAPCEGLGLLKNTRKKVMLLSATPINNSPEDLKNLILLFEDTRRCTIEGISNLDSFFAPYIKQYKDIITKRENDANPNKDNNEYTKQVDEIYNVLREKIIDKITIRRTRTNITNNPDYKKDLEAQNITFPEVLPPNTIIYKMNHDLENLFYETLVYLSDETAEKHLSYARYRAIEFLVDDKRQRYQHAQTTAHSLATIYKIHIVKRLESSFFAFKKSLSTLLRITGDMIRMYEEDKVIIAPDLNISKELEKGVVELDEIIEKAVAKGYDADAITFSQKDFTPEFYDKLLKDQEILNDLNQKWDKIHEDPKLDEFLASLRTTFMNPETNPSHKLVIFSESVDTVTYLSDELRNKGINALTISSQNRDALKTIIQQNFDANYQEQTDDYDIIISSDVLAEGVNLHRSNVIINYDSPWNATRLMQRIGRVNRIGSTSKYIYNYVFYPSDQGNRIISLYKNALVKLQGFHSAFGEDAQIFSKEEIVRQFELYNPDVKDSTDKRIKLLNEIRQIYLNDRKLYNRVKKLPVKSRSIRQTPNTHPNLKDSSIVFISSDIKTDYYLVTDNKVDNIDFLTAVDYFKANPEERPVEINSKHYSHITRANEKFKNEYTLLRDKNYSVQPNNPNSLTVNQKTARNFLENLLRIDSIAHNEDLTLQCKTLREYVLIGNYTKLITKLSKYGKYNTQPKKIIQDLGSILPVISDLYSQYKANLPISQDSSNQSQDKEIPTHQIIVSETFA